jgi:hypothetical protein
VLSAARDHFVAAETKRQGEAAGGDTLDRALLKTVRAQAENRGYAFAK